MSKKIKSLLKVADELQRIADRLREIAELEAQEEKGSKPTKERKRSYDNQSASETIQRLRTLSRDDAAKELDAMSHSLLEPIFSSLAQMSGKKKPKEMMVNKILWHLFDFTAGHEIAKNKPSDESR